jgi:hypothetical protein
MRTSFLTSIAQQADDWTSAEWVATWRADKKVFGKIKNWGAFSIMRRPWLELGTHVMICDGSIRREEKKKNACLYVKPRQTSIHNLYRLKVGTIKRLPYKNKNYSKTYTVPYTGWSSLQRNWMGVWKIFRYIEILLNKDSEFLLNS